MISRTVNDAESKLDKAGVYASQYVSYLLGEKYEESSGFNLVRRLEFAYSYKTRLEFGFASVSLSEPVIARCYPCAKQDLSARGYYLLARYLLAPARWSGTAARLSAGGGLGIVSAEASLEVDGTFGDNVWIREKVKTSERKTSLYLFTALEIPVSPSFSVGFSLDYALASSIMLPAIEHADIASQELDIGNASVGLTLGTHL